MIEVTEVDAARRFDVHRVARHDQLDRIPASDLAAGVSLAVDVERGQRGLASLLDEGVDVDLGLRGGDRLPTAHGLELAEVLDRDRVDRVHLQGALVGFGSVVQLAELGVSLPEPVEGVLIRAEAVHDAPVDLNGLRPSVRQGELDRLVDVLGPRFDALCEFGQSPALLRCVVYPTRA